MRGNLRKPKGVVFDMDGLIFDSERIVQYSWDVAGECLGFGKLGDNIYNTLGLNRNSRERYFKGKYGEDFPFEKFQEEYRKAFYEYVGDAGLPAKPGLHELLEVLKERDIKMAVATSSSHNHAIASIKREGIYPYFHTIITGNMVTEAKPSPEIYQKACAGLQILPKECLALEDAYNGIRSAHAAGMMTIMVPDLLKDTSFVEEILDGKMDSLLDVAHWITLLD